MSKGENGLDTDGLGERILAAAADCFGRYGVAKTSMVDIAKYAKVGRQSLYRRFPSKDAVIEAVTVSRVAAMLKSLRTIFSRPMDIEDRIIEAFLETLRLSEADAALKNIVIEAEDHRINRLFIFPESPLHIVARDLWSPILKHARDSGKLRHDLSDDMAVQYIRGFHYTIQMRTDISDEKRIIFAKNVLLTTLIFDKKNKYCPVL